MNKTQQWAVGLAAVLSAGLLGALIYRQFAGNGPLGPDASRLRETQERPQDGSGEGRGGFGTGALPAMPEGKVSVDEVVSGISADLDAETELLDLEAEAVESELAEEKDMLNDLENAYEEDQI